MAKNGKSDPLNAPKGVDISQYTEEEQLGFPPYWNPSEGASFVAVPAKFDDSDPEFERWYFQATHDMICHRGPKGDDGAEEMPVKKGDFFSTSNYAQFDTLGQYIGLPILIYVKGKRPLEKGKTMWEVGCRVSKETKAILNERRLRGAKQLTGGEANGGGRDLEA